MSTRLLAARVLSQVLREGQSLNAALSPALGQVENRDRGLLQELWYPQLQYLLGCLLKKPLKSREPELQALLLLGLYQLLHLRVPAYAVVAEAVTASHGLGKSWAAGLLNAVLRSFQRQRSTLLAELERDEASRTAHPPWLLRLLQSDWPDDWPALVVANNSRPTMGLRVNLARLSRRDYLERLVAAGVEAKPHPFACAGITLSQVCEVDKLPGFQEGLVSVQDPGAQLATDLLELRPGQRVLDSCAAPGGKTCHILEVEPKLNHLLALDADATRLDRVRENLRRLGLRAELALGDASLPVNWWDGQPYDRILLDAPCSSTGVIRRHPDIKVLREATDIAPLANRQYTLLEKLWPLLAHGGKLVYATCSLLKRENEFVIADFLASHPDAREQPIDVLWGRRALHGRQVLTGESDMDGFFYACLAKGDQSSANAIPE
jgi:16S rRNA (cytosine967-C5)-methyltransferase